MIVPELIDDDADRYDVAVVDGTPTLEAALQAAADSQDVDSTCGTWTTATRPSGPSRTARPTSRPSPGTQPEVIVKGDGGDAVDRPRAPGPQPSTGWPPSWAPRA